jgi:uncharacterized membrane protein YfcA
MDSILALPWWGIAWVAGVMLLAGFVHGAIGFGFPLVATPMLTLVLDLKTTILVSLVPTMVMTLISAFRGGMLRDSVLRFWFMPIMLVIGSYLGTRILIGANPAHFVLLLAVCLLAFLNLERLGKLEYRSVKENPRFWGVVTGLIAGLFESTANVSGPPLLMYFIMLGLAPSTLVQLLNFSFIGGKATQIITWTMSGGIGLGFWLSTVPWALMAVVTLFMGQRVRSRLDATAYMNWLRRFLWAMVVLLLIQYAWSQWGVHQQGVQ